MVATVCLLTCALATAQPAEGGEWQIAPRLQRGEELLYTGTFTEETAGRAVQFSRSDRLELRVFVLDATPLGTDAALFTAVREHRPGRGPSKEPAGATVRLDRAVVSPQGRVAPTAGAWPAVPLDGPAPAETGAFVEIPHGRLGRAQTWETPDGSRPPRRWQVAGSEAVNGTPCLRLVAVQQSDDWDEPRADRAAWRRRDSVWLAPNLGIALRFERQVEHRDPARRDPAQRCVTAYALENRMAYPPQLAEDRRREILLALQLAEKVKPCLKEPEKAGPKFFDEVLARVGQHLDKQPATPYREAVYQLQRRLEAARRGEAVAVEFTEEAASAPAVLALGQPAPDFVVPDLGKHESARLRKFLGRPVLMVFYSPASRHAAEILRFAESVRAAGAPEVTVLGMAVSEDADAVLKQRGDLGLGFPVLSGQGLRLTYAVEATPKFVVLDAAGVVRGTFVGWGRELPELVAEELNRWKRPARPGG
jgi:peroxiredoxin